jgi:hypothetical protein
VNDAYLTHAIRRVGMTNTSRRVRWMTKDITGKPIEIRYRVVIVSGTWSLERVKTASNGELLKAMGLEDEPQQPRQPPLFGPVAQ